MLIYAIVSMMLALTFYSIGVWGEKIQRVLKRWHLALFWCGFVFDTLGTTLMGEIAGGLFKFSFHGVTGMLAIVLMLFHAIWASAVLFGNNEKLKKNFHKFSIAVWLIWLVPFLSGAIFGVSV
jgi:uncharacterized repeat protein (TIGR03987 family)